VGLDSGLHKEDAWCRLMEQKKERRTYQETYFYMFILCILLTVISDRYGISVQQMTDYAEGFIKRFMVNMNSLIIWIVPISIMIKKEISAWRTDLYKKEIEIAKIKKDTGFSISEDQK